MDWKKLRIGYLKDDFAKPWDPSTPPLAAGATEEETKAYERRKANEPATPPASTTASSIWPRSMS